MALLLLYGLFVQRGLRTAMLVKDEFSKLLVTGLSFMFALQVFVIVGGTTPHIPLAPALPPRSCLRAGPAWWRAGCWSRCWPG